MGGNQRISFKFLNKREAFIIFGSECQTGVNLLGIFGEVQIVFEEVCASIRDQDEYILANDLEAFYGGLLICECGELFED